MSQPTRPGKLPEACVVWFRNEQRVAAELGAATSNPGLPGNKALWCRAQRLQARVADRPGELLPHLDALEGAQPWSARLTKVMADIESRLMGL